MTPGVNEGLHLKKKKSIFKMIKTVFVTSAICRTLVHKRLSLRWMMQDVGAAQRMLVWVLQKPTFVYRRKGSKVSLLY